MPLILSILPVKLENTGNWQKSMLTCSVYPLLGCHKVFRPKYSRMDQVKSVEASLFKLKKAWSIFFSLKASHNSVETLQSNAKNFRGHSFSKYYNWGTPIEIIADVKNSLKINWETRNKMSWIFAILRWQLWGNSYSYEVKFIKTERKCDCSFLVESFSLPVYVKPVTDI